tara:strand:+ start:1555 stop:2064 length:510 start_codon:yes stop_codon:yes gene_type:complete
MKVNTFLKKNKYVLYFALFIGVVLIIDYIFSENKVLSCGYKEGLKNAGEKKNKCKKCPEDSCVNGKCVKKAGFQNNVPSSTPSKVKNDVVIDVDVADKLENAFDNLQKLLGDDSLNNITTHSKKMVSQQKNLLNTVNSMGPNIKNAKKFLNKLNLPNIGVFSNLMQKML